MPSSTRKATGRNKRQISEIKVNRKERAAKVGKIAGGAGGFTPGGERWRWRCTKCGGMIDVVGIRKEKGDDGAFHDTAYGVCRKCLLASRKRVTGRHGCLIEMFGVDDGRFSPPWSGEDEGR